MKLIHAGKLSGYAVRVHGCEAPRRRLKIGDKWVWFDFDEHFGPLLTTNLGEPLKDQPISEDHPFWEPFEKWLVTYRREKAYAAKAQRRANADTAEPS